MRKKSTLSLALLVCAGVLARSATGQDLDNPHGPRPTDSPEQVAPPASAPPESAQLAAKPSRAEVANAYMRFERTFRARPPAGELLTTVNQRFDLLTLRFFRGETAGVVRDLNELTNLVSERTLTGSESLAQSLRAAVTPRLWVYYSSPGPIVRVESLFAVDQTVLSSAGQLSLSVLPANGAGGATFSMPAPNRSGTVEGTIDMSPAFATLPAGRYEVVVTGEGGLHWKLGDWTVVSAPRDAVRERLTGEIKRHTPTIAPELQRAVTIFMARAALLKDAPSDSVSGEFLADQVELENELIREKTAILGGRNPYGSRAGEIYRVFGEAGQQVPVRVFAPQGIESAKPMPLVIALHGAGGDEGFFFHAYGNGQIKELAQDRRFIVAAPLAYVFMTNPSMLDRLLESLEGDYPIDRSRVYLIGHSMGAIAASALAQVKCDLIAGAACIAGLRPFVRSQPCAPVLAFAGELDPIIPASRIAQAARGGIEMGKPVELRTVKGYGHTLVVNAVLGDAVEWLLARAGPKAPGDGSDPPAGK